MIIRSRFFQLGCNWFLIIGQRSTRIQRKRDPKMSEQWCCPTCITMYTWWVNEHNINDSSFKIKTSILLNNWQRISTMFTWNPPSLKRTLPRADPVERPTDFICDQVNKLADGVWIPELIQCFPQKMVSQLPRRFCKLEGRSNRKLLHKHQCWTLLIHFGDMVLDLSTWIKLEATTAENVMSAVKAMVKDWMGVWSWSLVGLKFFFIFQDLSFFRQQHHPELDLCFQVLSSPKNCCNVAYVSWSFDLATTFIVQHVLHIISNVLHLCKTGSQESGGASSSWTRALAKFKPSSKNGARDFFRTTKLPVDRLAKKQF